MRTNDNELLRRYVLDRSEAAFAELVERYLGLAYSAALRQMDGDIQAAEDATQAVFVVEKHAFAKIGLRLGVRENAARMRVERALLIFRGPRSGCTSSPATRRVLP